MRQSSGGGGGGFCAVTVAVAEAVAVAVADAVAVAVLVAIAPASGRSTVGSFVAGVDSAHAATLNATPIDAARATRAKYGAPPAGAGASEA